MPQSDHAPCVLLVDDEFAVLEVVREMAASLGWRVLPAPSAALALRWLRDGEQVTHALVDLHMPGTGGAELARTLRRQRPELTVDFMTGDEFAAREIVDLEGVADGVLVKPFSIHELEAALAGRVRA